MVPFEMTDWDSVEPLAYPGETGTAWWRVKEFNGMRIRLVEYSPDYRADHWCPKGHIIYCLQGAFITHFKDGSHQFVTGDMSCHLSDNEANPHLMSSENGCKLFVIDGFSDKR